MQTEQALRETQYRLRLEQEQGADLHSEMAMERARRFSMEQEIETVHQELVSMAQQILNERFEAASLRRKAAGAEAVAEVYRERAQTAEAAAQRFQEEAQALQQILSARAMTAGHPKASVSRHRARGPVSKRLATCAVPPPCHKVSSPPDPCPSLMLSGAAICLPLQ